MKIKILDENTINKIAAGEVIERPASVIKELIENSLDAKASLVKIEIEDGGKRLIKITDNGQGISKEDLKLAPVRHATSKISKLDDIYNQVSMGFRGEALASICHVAKLTIISKTDGDNAYLITAAPEISTPSITNHAQGTSIIVQDLFSKIPVRKQYLKSAATEYSYIYENVKKFALLFPEIDFVLVNNGKEVLNTQGIKNQKEIIIYLFGKDIRADLIKIENKINNIEINGYISSPKLTFNNRGREIVAVNNRIIKNALISKVFYKCYEDLIPRGRFPLIVLKIETHPKTID
ncbi:DNA mismatch repair endonuclease MutL, partial [Candidatus Margulisiibacteriota bacterium]